MIGKPLIADSLSCISWKLYYVYEAEAFLGSENLFVIKVACPSMLVVGLFAIIYSDSENYCLNISSVDSKRIVFLVLSFSLSIICRDYIL